MEVVTGHTEGMINKTPIDKKPPRVDYVPTNFSAGATKAMCEALGQRLPKEKPAPVKPAADPEA